MKVQKKASLILLIFLIALVVTIAAKINNFQLSEESLAASGYVFAFISAIAIIASYIYAKTFLESGWRRNLIFSVGFFTIAAHVAEYSYLVLSKGFDGFNLGIFHFIAGMVLGSAIFFVGGVIQNKKLFEDRKLLLIKSIIAIVAFNALLIILEIMAISQLFELYIAGKGITRVGRIAIGIMAVSLYATAAVYFFNKYIKSYSQEMMFITLGFILMGSTALSFFFVERVGDLMSWLGRGFSILAFLVFIYSVKFSGKVAKG